MDLSTITTLTAFLSPFLPHLVKLGEKAAEEGGKKLGAEAWETAKKFWSKLSPKIEEKEAAREAVEDVAAAPEDEEARASLSYQLKKLLKENQELAAEIEHMVKQTPPAVITTVTASGIGSVAVGRDVVGGTISTRVGPDTPGSKETSGIVSMG